MRKRLSNMDPTVFWCTPCKKWHAGECSDTVSGPSKIRLSLDTEHTDLYGMRTYFANLIVDSKAQIMIGNRIYKISDWEKKHNFVFVDFEEVKWSW